MYLQGLVSVGGCGEGGHCIVGRLGRGVRWWVVLSVQKGAVVTVFVSWPAAEKFGTAASTRHFRSVLVQSAGRCVLGWSAGLSFVRVVPDLCPLLCLLPLLPPLLRRAVNA